MGRTGSGWLVTCVDSPVIRSSQSLKLIHEFILIEEGFMIHTSFMIHSSLKHIHEEGSHPTVFNIYPPPPFPLPTHTLKPLPPHTTLTQIHPTHTHS